MPNRVSAVLALRYVFAVAHFILWICVLCYKYGPPNAKTALFSTNYRGSVATQRMGPVLTMKQRAANDRFYRQHFRNITTQFLSENRWTRVRILLSDLCNFLSQ